MRRIHPVVLLYILVTVVPLVVGGAGLVAFLLLRAGYGFVVWALLPLLAVLLLTGVIGAGLGVAAGGTLPGTRRREEEKPREGTTREGPDRGDDV